MKGLARFSYRLLGRYVYRYRERFEWLQDDLKKARLPYSLDEYLSLLVLLATAAFLLSLLVAYYFLSGFPVVVREITTLLAAAFVTGLVVFYLFNHPKIVAINRGSNIDAILPIAITHMSTLAGSGIPPHHIFRIMGKIEKYGEISRECRLIYRDVTALGKDIFTALSDAAKNSPSRLWAEILWGISSTLRSGGSLRDYLYMKSRELQALLERHEKEAVESMNLLTEIYLIVFVMGPILAAIMLILMGMLSGGRIFGVQPLTLLSLLVYVVMPAAGLVFLLITDNIRPREVR